jgi:lipopolysaccharide/colanic/teichoic acid biosynthesis glycosyltransferase
MAKRLMDLAGAALGLAVVAPLLALAAVAVRLSSPGPVLFRARRAGVRGRPFTMFKLRTMRAGPPGSGSRITGAEDPRVFPLCRLLRRSKLDELPQLLNVLRGEMSLVGPRPEDPDLVARYYTPLHRETLSVRPGLTSPGTLYYEAQSDRLLTGSDPERRYAETILPLKLALDLVYVRRASLRGDVALLGRTLLLLAGRLAGRRQFPEPPEMAEALALVVPALHARRSPGTSDARLTAPEPRRAAAGGAP